jgi:hypothetical protein
LSPPASRLVTRVIAGILVAGALLGLYAAFSQFFHVVGGRRVMFPLKALPVIALWVGSGVVGVWLWIDAAAARMFALVILALQIPVVATEAISLYWYSLSQTGVVLVFAPEGVLLRFVATLGSGMRFLIGMSKVNAAFGINVVALAAFLCLMRSSPSLDRRRLPAP